MHIAFVSDIHGNLVALEAVLQDMRQHAIDRVICLGDVATSGPQPHETVSRLRDLGWPTITGNTDAWLLDPQPYTGASEFYRTISDLHTWCAHQLTPEDFDFLRSFQSTLEIDLGDDCRLLAYHGLPRSNTGWLTVTTPDEDLENLIGGYQANVLVGGHTHQQMLRRFRQQYLINPGSAGLAYEQVSPEIGNVNLPLAEYALVRLDQGQLSVEFRRVPYSLEALFQPARTSGMPHLDWWLRKWKR